MSVKQKEIWRSLYPFDPRFCNLGTLRMSYVDEQKGQKPGNAAREVLLMVHGNPTWSFYYRNLIVAFRDRYRVIAPDHLGCGLSDKPGETEYSFQLEQRIDDLLHLIKELDLRRITLIAHDWGGAIGLGAAVREPNRFDRFVLMNTAGFFSPTCPLRIRLGMIPFFGRFAIQGLNLFCQAALKMAPANPKKLPREVKAGLLAPYNNWHNRTAVYKFVKDIPLSDKHPSFHTLAEIETALPRFRDNPIALIWGMQDWCFTPEFLKRFLQIFPEADVHRLDGAGHYILEDAPQEVIKAIERFLVAKPVFSTP